MPNEERRRDNDRLRHDGRLRHDDRLRHDGRLRDNEWQRTMISLTIVIGTVLLALVYIGIWCVSPRFRRQIEQPKHWFQDQLEKYDRDRESDAD